MNRVLFSIALVLALCIPTWATYASPHTPAHEAPTTKEWTFQETIQTRSNHWVVDNDDRRMPSGVSILCTDPVQIELVVPLHEYPWAGVVSYVPLFEADIDEDGYYWAWFDAENSFGGFEYEEMYFRLRNVDDPTKHFTGSACHAFWYYDIPLREEASSETFENSGCLSAWSDYCV